MKLYIAVTPDEYELPLFVTDSVQEMAAWANIKVKSVQELCSRNSKKEPFTRIKGGCVHSSHRIRKIIIEEDTP